MPSGVVMRLYGFAIGLFSTLMGIARRDIVPVYSQGGVP